MTPQTYIPWLYSHLPAFKSLAYTDCVENWPLVALCVCNRSKVLCGLPMEAHKWPWAGTMRCFPPENSGSQPAQEQNEKACVRLPAAHRHSPYSGCLLTAPTSLRTGQLHREKNALYSLSNYQLHLPWKQARAQIMHMIQNIIVRLWRSGTIKKKWVTVNGLIEQKK